MDLDLYPELGFTGDSKRNLTVEMVHYLNSLLNCTTETVERLLDPYNGHAATPRWMVGKRLALMQAAAEDCSDGL
ncbi:hypothetical protein VTN77DRAFT_9675 [Rasamsonia byssochlamydoides]|uniref:uncharacterized protein n=1 Tax=Rasamsonia byssochlamydoides TaxID=89139 RepID=UPI0037447A1B